MINKSMKHFIYKTTHKNGKYYVGRHSTENIDDGYIGSGQWVKQIKDKTTLTREILEYADSTEQIKDLEGKYLAEHFGRPQCMNRTPDPVGFDSENNPMKDLSVAAKISGDNHWSHKNPEKTIKGDNHWMNKNTDAREQFLKEVLPKSNKALIESNKIKMQNGTHHNLVNNPSTWRAEQGIHHWQHGKSPNADGKLNKKLVEEGRHNFQGPDLNNKRIAAGTHNFVGADNNAKRLAAGTHPSQQKATCEHCNKTTSVAMHKRWHGDNCKQK